MEKLTFTNPNGESIEFSQESIYKWRNVEGLGALTSTFQTDKTVFEDGETIIDDGTFDSRILVLSLNIISTDIYPHLRRLNRVLNPRLGNGTLKYETGTGIIRVFNTVRVRTMPTLNQESARRAGFQPTIVTFNLFDPVMYDEAFNERILITQQPSFEFPLEIDSVLGVEFGTIFTGGFPVPNIGDLTTPVVLEMDGPLTSPIVVRNATSNEEIVINASILTNERLIIETDIRNINVTKVLADSTEEKAFNDLDIDATDFWQLQLGENNIVLTSGGTVLENATIRWKNKYVGI